MSPFLQNALLAGIGLALISAPLGCLVVWRRMAYIGETIAQAGLIGVALGLLLRLDLTATTLVATAAMALLLAVLVRRTTVPVDSLLGLLAHGALAAGVVATTQVRSGSVDLMGYLFGDIFAVALVDLAWIAGTGVIVSMVLVVLWPSLVRIAVHKELAAAEGLPADRIDLMFLLLLAIAIAVSIKIVGVLLAVAFLIMPAVAARPFASTPEGMVAGAALVSVGGVLAGLALSFNVDVPGGPAIVLVLAAAALSSLAVQSARGRTA